MKRYRITLGGESFEVELLSDPRQPEVRVAVDGEELTVAVEELAEAEAAAGSAVVVPQSAARSAVAAARAATVGNAVTAPLPGVIKSIAVRAGQRVAANDALVVIEAMKMDNVVRAQRGGVVSAVHVSEGRQVAHGALLLDLD